MSAACDRFRLDGLEPQNFLAFLTLVGTLRALEAAERDSAESERWWPRASWDVEHPPWRPVLHLARSVTEEELCERIEEGIGRFADAHKIPGKTPDFDLTTYRHLAEKALQRPNREGRLRLDVLAALATDQILDVATKGQMKSNAPDGGPQESIKSLEIRVTPTPLCLLSGQGHQYFLERFQRVPFEGGEEGGARGIDIIAKALFAKWEYADNLVYSFRWDPGETARQALMAGDPTDKAYSLKTERGANKLAAIGLSAFPVMATSNRKPTIPGCLDNGSRTFLAWPIWRHPVSLAALSALLTHEDLEKPEALAHLGVITVYGAPIVSLDRYKTIGPGEPVVSARG